MEIVRDSVDICALPVAVDFLSLMANGKKNGSVRLSKICSSVFGFRAG